MRAVVPEWRVPDVLEEHLQFRVTHRVLEEFALGHTASDVLRELVQNEYDAGGSALNIVFGDRGLTVTGNGRPIDELGWKRLSVMLGTGQVAGARGEAIPQKVNGIGSKNFGLRALFLFGDRIFIRSGGLQTILDREQGTWPEPRPDESSSGKPGVAIYVPYRLGGDERLRPFDVEREGEALSGIAAELAPTLVKLARPGATGSVRRVTVKSERLGRVLAWTQSVRDLPGRQRAVRRQIRIARSGELFPGVPGTITETEYQLSVRPPSGLRGPSLPGYFKVSGGRLRIGLSVRNRGPRLDTSAVGMFFYPLGAHRTRTGFPFSISAPFEMNEDRSQVLDLVNSEWNAWLIETASTFAVGLLTTSLYETFGPDAYLIFDSSGAATATVAALPERVQARLHEEECWPTQARVGRQRRPQYKKASSLVLPDSEALARFVARNLSADVLLDGPLLERESTRKLAVAMAARSFTVSSLVRLRCAGKDEYQTLATKLKANEANYHYTEFPANLADEARQASFSKVLDEESHRLTESHRSDLKNSPTTLTAAGTLAAPGGLWVVDPAVARMVNDGDRLHPILGDSKVLKALCQPFKISDWAIKVADRSVAGLVADDERMSLFAYLTANPDLTRKAWSALRTAPVLMDHRGEWTSSDHMVLRTARGASYVEPALRFPSSALEGTKALGNLRVRSALAPEDLVKLAQLVERGAVAPDVFRTVLIRVPALLTPAAADRLRSLDCLETQNGARVSPAAAYIRTERVLTCLGEAAAYPTGLPVATLRRLGCRASPTFDDLLDRLRQLRANGSWPTRTDVLYAALVEAAQTERRTASAHRSEPILWAGEAWAAPENCLVGREHVSTFLNAVPVLRGPLEREYIALGAHVKPQPSHWRQFFRWVDETDPEPRVVDRRTRQALTKAYLAIPAPAELSLPPSRRCLLNRRGRLNSLDDARQGRFLIDDDPALANAVEEAGGAIGFAEMSEPRASRFFRAVGTQALSDVAKPRSREVGEEQQPRDALRVPRLLERLWDPLFASAVAALAAFVGDPQHTRTVQQLTKTINRLERITFVTTLTYHYRVGSVDVRVPRAFQVDPNRIVVSGVRTRDDLRLSIARAVAGLADPSPGGELRLSDPVFVLLSRGSTAQMKAYLEQRGVSWSPDRQLGWNEVPPDPENDEDQQEDIADVVRRVVVEDALRTRVPSSPPLDVKGMGAAVSRAPRPPLPDFSTVEESEVPDSHWSAPTGATSGGYSGGGGWWAPRSAEEERADAELGRRGEELVLRRERERVAALGFPVERVVWSSDGNPAADHDIKSVADNGGDLWIEVKATTGREGRFTWPRSEFNLAMQERQRYVLCRVYLANTLRPVIRRIQDPIGHLVAGEMRLELNNLTAEVEPL